MPDDGLIDDTVGVELLLYVNVNELGKIMPFDVTRTEAGDVLDPCAGT